MKDIVKKLIQQIFFVGYLLDKMYISVVQNVPTCRAKSVIWPVEGICVDRH